MHRFFADERGLQGGIAQLGAEDSQHALRVLRLTCGEEIELVCPPQRYLARIEAIGDGIVRVRVVHGDLLEKADEMADVIVANIIADVICFLCGPAKKHLLPGGTFICSGIIREREDDVQRALAQAGYTVCNRLAKGEWVCLAATL